MTFPRASMRSKTRIPSRDSACRCEESVFMPGTCGGPSPGLRPGRGCGKVSRPQLWQGLQTCHSERPKVSRRVAARRRQTAGRADGGVGRPSPNVGRLRSRFRSRSGFVLKPFPAVVARSPDLPLRATVGLASGRQSSAADLRSRGRRIGSPLSNVEAAAVPCVTDTPVGARTTIIRGGGKTAPSKVALERLF